MSTLNDSTVLQDAILETARRQRDEILGRAREEADRLRRAAVAEAARAREEGLDQARREGERRGTAIRGSVPVEIGRARAARVEALLEAIRATVRDRLRAPGKADAVKTVQALAAAAIGKMEGESFVVRLAARDYPLLADGLAEELRRLTGRPALEVRAREDNEIPSGGVIVEDAAGQRIWDNRPDARLKRLWPEIRSRIALSTPLLRDGATGGSL